MEVEPVALLGHLENLYQRPSGARRFQAYLELITDEDGDDLELVPLGLANPMAKAHVLDHVRALMAADAEAVVAETACQAADELDGLEASFRIGLVVLDDVAGGWTDRARTDLDHRFRSKAERDRGWISVVVWASEHPGPEADELALRTREAVYRAAYQLAHGMPTRLADMLHQEALVACWAGRRAPTLPPDERERAEAILEARGQATDIATAIAALYGDRAAKRLGHRTLGIGPGRLLALATAEIEARGEDPARALDQV